MFLLQPQELYPSLLCNVQGVLQLGPEAFFGCQIGRRTKPGSSAARPAGLCQPYKNSSLEIK
eukprot:1042892-Pelagomonas_calceolata.AAC.3